MCSVVRCESWRRNTRRFALPEDPEKRLEWVQFVLKVNSQRLKESSCTDISVCSEHFTCDCFINQTSASDTVQLKSGAVPTVYVKEEPEEVEIKEEPVEIEATDFCCEQLKQSDSPAPAPIENTSSSTGASPICSLNHYSDSSSDIISILQKIKNLDIIREKAALLQKPKMYVINEKQLFQLFQSKCPLCHSEAKMKKMVHGVHLILILECLQCDYTKKWKNLSSAEDMDVAECMEVSLDSSDEQSGNTKVPEISETVEESDVSSDPEENSDDDWQPEEEQLFFEQLLSESDKDGSYEDDDLVHKDSRLCTDCGKFYNRQKSHLCLHKLKPYSCNICGKRCVSEVALTIHSKVHDVNYQHPCKYCHVTFKTKTDKIAHEQTHSAEKTPYRCSDCSKTFAKNRQRRNHMIHHRGPDKYKCKVCGLVFTRGLPLQRHLLVHTGEKPFKCSVCQRGFNQPSHLKSHMRLHTGERPYKCPHCDKCFNHNVSLKSHILRSHKPNSRSGAKRKMNEGKDDGCDAQSIERGVGSEVDDVEEEQNIDDEGQIHRICVTKCKRYRTGRPVGRPKRGKAEKLQNTKARKVQKSKATQSSSEESQESFDSTEEEDERSVQRSREPIGSDSESDFELDIKTRGSKNVT